MNSGKYIRIKIGACDGGRTVESVLKERFALSRGLARRIKREAEVYINNTPSHLSDRLTESDDLVINLEFNENSNIEPECLPLNILYEDEDLLVLNKPPGMLVHPVAGEETGTLANGVMSHWLDINKRHPVYRPVYRIDRDTSGLVLVSGNHLAHIGLQRQLNNKTMARIYLALVEGLVQENAGTVALPIKRKPGSIVEREVAVDGKEAVTNYLTLKRLSHINATLLELSLATGRTHQIRVHFSHLGHPLLGDSMYGGNMQLITRQALHSYRLEFNHPITGKKCMFSCPLPEDMLYLTGGILESIDLTGILI